MNVSSGCGHSSPSHKRSARNFPKAEPGLPARQGSIASIIPCETSDFDSTFLSTKEDDELGLVSPKAAECKENVRVYVRVRPMNSKVWTEKCNRFE